MYQETFYNQRNSVWISLWKTKSGLKTVTEARKARKAAMVQYENYGHVVKDQISVADFFEIWFEKDCMVDLKATINLL